MVSRKRADARGGHDRLLAADSSITHVAVVHLRDGHGHPESRCMTSHSSWPKHGKGLIVDAMSSFGALEIDARKTRLRPWSPRPGSASKACRAWAL